MKIKYVIVIIYLFIVISMAGCGANIFSTDQEVSMGLEFSKEIENQLKLLENDEWENYVNTIGDKLVNVCDRQDIKYTFSIVDDSTTVNAFALPGGFIYIYSGLILRAENEAELAGVIAHEIGHVVGKHGMKKLTNIYGYQLIIALALGQDPGELTKLTADIIGGAGIMQYGRSNEHESDMYGVKYSYNAGYDPNGIATFFEKLDNISKKQPTALEKMFSTHPVPKERILKVKEQIALLPEKEELTLGTDRFTKMKKTLYMK